jgi:hypothetical protein
MVMHEVKIVFSIGNNQASPLDILLEIRQKMREMVRDKKLTGFVMETPSAENEIVPIYAPIDGQGVVE